MESLVKNEYLPATTNPPVVTKTAAPTVMESPPPYASNIITPPQQTVLVRSTYDEIPRGVTVKAIVSIVVSAIVIFCTWLTLCCGIPSIIYASMALSPSYDANQRKKYANIALGLMLGGLVTMVIIVVLFVVYITTYDYY